MSSIPLRVPEDALKWRLPYKSRVGMAALIVGESALFTIFVVAYIFYLGRSLTGPKPSDVLEVPVLGTICLLSSSLTIWRAERAIENDRRRSFTVWLATTVVLAVCFLVGTALEWHKLIYRDGLTISTNLFGTTFYSLVGLHATHVIVGLFLLSAVLLFSLFGWIDQRQSDRFSVVALYWHFVDAVWVVVFTVVYLIGR
ncbi:heme-copper oxidase subunit III [Terriglobus albidus]|uniref:Heme-copper oxidase subunit III n=1 Tax=Terriglobus albidus TaxID=1592106 RepID=A0A5B9EF06_9BACT|nr:cytochrome c oxidase subunit 3 [Terriglobus albidus]QEE28897.1 heme-copper oxidase subunit III [Terriglobus albidus]